MEAFMNWINDIATGLSENPQIREIAANNKLLAPLIENPFILLFIIASLIYFAVSKIIKHFKYMNLKDDIDLQAKVAKEKRRKKKIEAELDDDSELNHLRRKLEREREDKERIEREKREWEMEKLRIQTEKEKEELRRMINGGNPTNPGYGNPGYGVPGYGTPGYPGYGVIPGYSPYNGYVPPTGPLVGPGVGVPPSSITPSDTTPKETKVEAPEVIIKEVPVIKEIIKEIPVEREIVKEVEVIKEVPIEKEIIKEVAVIKEVAIEKETPKEVPEQPLLEVPELMDPEEELFGASILEEGVVNNKFSDGFDNEDGDSTVNDILVPKVIEKEPEEEVKVEEPKELIDYLPDMEEEPEEIDTSMEGDAYEQLMNKWNKEADKKKRFREKKEEIQSVKETNMEILNQRNSTMKETIIEKESPEPIDTDLNNLSADDKKRMKSAQKAMNKEKKKQEKEAAKAAAQPDGKKKRLF